MQSHFNVTEKQLQTCKYQAKGRGQCIPPRIRTGKHTCNDNQRLLFLSLISYNHIGKIVVSTNVLSAKEANKMKYCKWLCAKYSWSQWLHSAPNLHVRKLRRKGKLQIWSRAFLNWSRSEEAFRDCKYWSESLIFERWSTYHCRNAILKVLLMVSGFFNPSFCYSP